MDLDDKPWVGLPEGISVALRDRAGEIVDDIVATVRSTVPAYSGQTPTTAVQEALGRLRQGVELGLAQFATLIENPDATVADRADFYRLLGRTAHDAGLGLDVMNAGYRVVARTAWRWIDGIVAAASPAPGSPLRLAEAVFVFVDALSDYSAEGYAEGAAAAAGERHERRSRLVELLLQPGHGAGALRDAAQAAGWRAPATLAAVALAHGDRASQIAGRIDPDVLAGFSGGGWCLLIPSPSAPGRRALIDRALLGHNAAIGPEVPTDLANRSLAWAKQVLELHPGHDQAGAATRADEHLTELLLMQDQELLTIFIERRLAPLQALPAGAHTRLGDTLLAWLKHDGSAPKAGVELNAHTQTVRYRLSQIREIFTDELDDPEARFELEIALRAERFLPSRR